MLIGIIRGIMASTGAGGGNGSEQLSKLERIVTLFHIFITFHSSLPFSIVITRSESVKFNDPIAALSLVSAVPLR